MTDGLPSRGSSDSRRRGLRGAGARAPTSGSVSRSGGDAGGAPGAAGGQAAGAVGCALRAHGNDQARPPGAAGGAASCSCGGSSGGEPAVLKNEAKRAPRLPPKWPGVALDVVGTNARAASDCVGVRSGGRDIARARVRVGEV